MLVALAVQPWTRTTCRWVTVLVKSGAGGAADGPGRRRGYGQRDRADRRGQSHQAAAQARRRAKTGTALAAATALLLSASTVCSPRQNCPDSPFSESYSPARCSEPSAGPCFVKALTKVPTPPGPHAASYADKRRCSTSPPNY
jgi:hypothetical protein